jgi:hypothetical protein
MTGSASCRKPLLALGSLQLGSWALERSDRGGQDKAHKVRAVGWDAFYLKTTAIQQTLRDNDRTLQFSTTHYRRSTFDTL